MPEKTRRGRNHLSPWTVKEMSSLENKYGKFSAQDIGDTLGRSAGAVRGVARKLGLSTPRPPVWTEEELALIRVNYYKGIMFVHSLLPGRTIYAIRIQASLMGVTNASWGDEELRYLEAHHGSVPIARIAASLGRSAKGVADMDRKMGLAKRPETINVPWSEQVLEILWAHYGSGAWITRVQALLPGRTKGAIGVQANKMGIRESQNWSPEEIEILREYYPYPGSEIAKKLPHRTVAAIKTQASRLKIKKFHNRNVIFDSSVKEVDE
ncbi:SANT/Myb-like DNA-binding domain-containing protein [Yersinia enterocolitica]|uniref:Uncharacterized protein n=2 Tax=Gammaproteobacteria TaxID=1236 RepID=A0ABY2PYI5_9ENTR|nr:MULTISPECIES: SANT/Myb-like DNA-binding domain-containing protein [Yersinia]THE40787.1 hypothetical protein DJ535_08185 [Citrobacter murliniae]HBA3067218.1 SANT/Myb domain-containing protein [Escherichia coli]EME3604193.1 SANT/Myb domain-containing protein [Yersinia enterocolitica]UYK05838.1 SANT/Myb-like DNA-binding domain-containing protein [Yersinia enterocolitica]CCQ42311.1 hypothetical proein [Yersinia enterocolitica (type O:5) str. YE53/03]